MNQITKALSRVESTNIAIVSMGYDNIESYIILYRGEGDKFPDPLTNGSYDIIWWNGSDYVTPIDDPHVEIVRCIAKVGDTLIVMRSQLQTPASPKNIYGKLYNMMYLHDESLKTLSFYNAPQPHGSSVHTGTVATLASSQFINQGTTTSLLHGNATGNPSWSQVATTDITDANVTYAKIQNISATDKVLGRVTAGAGTIEEISCTAAGRALLDDADATSQRSTLGLGTMSTQASNSVSITGGSITGITDLALADGGTGASDASTARTNLGLGSMSTQASTAVSITGGTITGSTIKTVVGLQLPVGTNKWVT